MNEYKKSDILLESGINEIEILVFSIKNSLYGINVAKVREIMKFEPVIPIHLSNEHVEGIFKPRDKVITVIDLALHLGIEKSENPERDIFIITSFNNSEYAFHTHAVNGIYRISCTQLKKPDPVIFGGKEGVATGIVELDKNLITILDFEAIIAKICPETGLNILDIPNPGDIERKNKNILIAEDSTLLSKMIVESLHKAGYKDTVKTNNGQEAWDYLSNLINSGEDIKKHISCIITDIEMPLMDGHRLTKLIKADKGLKNIPLIIFSSLINDEMRIKGEELGADAQITKPEIGKLVEVIDKLTK